MSLNNINIIIRVIHCRCYIYVNVSFKQPDSFAFFISRYLVALRYSGQGYQKVISPNSKCESEEYKLPYKSRLQMHRSKVRGYSLPDSDEVEMQPRNGST